MTAVPCCPRAPPDPVRACPVPWLCRPHASPLLPGSEEPHENEATPVARGDLRRPVPPPGRTRRGGERRPGRPRRRLRPSSPPPRPPPRPTPPAASSANTRRRTSATATRPPTGKARTTSSRSGSRPTSARPSAVAQLVLKLPSNWEARTETFSVQGSTDRHRLQRSEGLGRLPLRPRDGNTVTVDVTGEHPVRPAERHGQHRLARRAAVGVRGARPGRRGHAAAVRARQPRLHPAGERPDPAHLVGLDRQHRRHRLRRLRQRPAPRQRRRDRPDLHGQPAGRHDRVVLRPREGRRGQPVGEQQHRDPHRHAVRDEPRAGQADHGVLGAVHLRRHERQRRLPDDVLGRRRRDLPEPADRRARLQRRRRPRHRQAQPGPRVGPADPDDRRRRPRAEFDRVHDAVRRADLQLRPEQRQHRHHPAERPRRRRPPARHRQLRRRRRAGRGVPGLRRARAQPGPDGLGRVLVAAEPGRDRRDHRVGDRPQRRHAGRRARRTSTSTWAPRRSAPRTSARWPPGRRRRCRRTSAPGTRAATS